MTGKRKVAQPWKRILLSHKGKEILPPAALWRDLEDTALGEMNCKKTTTEPPDSCEASQVVGFREAERMELGLGLGLNGHRVSDSGVGRQ